MHTHFGLTAITVHTGTHHMLHKHTSQATQAHITGHTNTHRYTSQATEAHIADHTGTHHMSHITNFGRVITTAHHTSQHTPTIVSVLIELGHSIHQSNSPLMSCPPSKQNGVETGHPVLGEVGQAGLQHARKPIHHLHAKLQLPFGAQGRD